MHIAILTPLHNGVEFLTECVMSVLDQTYTSWEMWIGVNGHPGGEAKEVFSLAFSLASLDSHRRIRVVAQPPSVRGKAASLNHLVGQLDLATEWVALLDCDDVWHPQKLEKQVAALGGVAQGATVVGTMCEYFGDMLGVPNIPTGWINSHWLADMNPIINSSVLLKREACVWAVEHPSWEGGYTPLEDYELWMRVVLGGGRMFNIPERLTRHRIHGGSAFNSRGHAPAPLQAWFRGAIAASKN